METSLVVMKLLKAIANDLFAYNRQTQSKVLTSNAQELINFRSNYNMQLGKADKAFSFFFFTTIALTR